MSSPSIIVFFYFEQGIVYCMIHHSLEYKSTAIKIKKISKEEESALDEKEKINYQSVNNKTIRK